MDGDGLSFSRSDLLSDLSTNDVLQSVLSAMHSLLKNLFYYKNVQV